MKTVVGSSFAMVHQSVEEATEKMLLELKRYNYVTPTHYLELVKGYSEILDKKRGEMHAERVLRGGSRGHAPAAGPGEDPRDRVLAVGDFVLAHQEWCHRRGRCGGRRRLRGRGCEAQARPGLSLPDDEGGLETPIAVYLHPHSYPSPHQVS